MTRSRSRTDVRKQVKRRRLISLALLLICVVSAPFWSGWLTDLLAANSLAHWPGCELRVVQYEGLSYLTEDSLSSLANFPMHTSLFDVDSKSIKALIESHPWVNRATLHRRLPNCIKVMVEEHVPVATIRSNDLYALSANGAVLSVPTQEWVWNLPMITPPTALQLWPGDVVQDAKTLALLNQVVSVRDVVPDLWPNLSELYFHENEIRATLLTPPVILKMSGTVESRTWLALEQLLRSGNAAVAESPAVAIIDLRVPGNIVVTSTELKKSSQEPIGA